MNIKDTTVRFDGDTSGFDQAVEKAKTSAKKFESVLNQVGDALDNFFNASRQNGNQLQRVFSDDKTVKGMRDTLGLYKGLSAAVKEYTNAARGLANLDESSAQGFARSLEAMGNALRKVGVTSKEQYEGLNRTLQLYKTAAQAANTTTQANQRIAASERKVAQATEQTTKALRNRQYVASGGRQSQVHSANLEADPRLGNRYAEQTKAVFHTESLLRSQSASYARFSDDVIRQAHRRANMEATEAGRARLAEEKALDARMRAYREYNEKINSMFASGNKSLNNVLGDRNDPLSNRRGGMIGDFRREQRRTQNAADAAAFDKEFERLSRETSGGANAITQQNDALRDNEQLQQRTRYALYETATAYTVAATAATGLVTAIAGTAVQYEAWFAQVARTTQADGTPQLQALREEFMAISQEIPVSFEELSKIGTLGAQMGIAVSDLDEFSEVVAKFSATTDVSVDAAAVSFGRLASMMEDLDASHFQNAASAISELGTASVATESEILTVAESIATTANMTGFSTEEVLGLSSALASLKVRPELARGGLQRIFAEINEAAGEGGEALQNYADVLGVTAAEADQMWRNDPSQFFQRLAEAVGQVTDNVARQNMIREELGIRNTRDIEVLSRLANGYDVYAQSMDLAEESYAKGTYLDDEASVIFDTTAAALTRLANAFKNMMSNLGESTLTPITMFAEVMIRVFDVIGSLPPEITGLALSVGVLTAGFLAYQAILARSAATAYGFYEVQQAMGGSFTLTTGKVRELWMSLYRTDAAQKTAAVSANTLAAAEGRVAGAAGAASTSNAALATSTTAAGTSAGVATGMFARLWTVIKAHPLGALATAVFALAPVVTSLWQRFSDGSEEAQQKTEEFLSTVGGGSALFDALKKDAADFASGVQTESFGEIAVSYETAAVAARSVSDVMSDELAPSTDKVTGALEKQGAQLSENTMLIGENADALLRQAFAQSSMWEGLDTEQFQAAMAGGLDFEELYERVADAGWGEAGQRAGRRYIDGLIDSVDDLRDEAQANLTRIAQEVPDVAPGSDEYIALEEQAEAASELIDLYDRQAAGLREVRDGLGDTSVELGGLSNQAIVTAAVVGDLDEATEDAGDSFDGATDEVDEFGDALQGLVSDMFAIIDAEAGLESAMASLGESIAENGLDFTTVTEEGRANLDALQGSMDAAAQYFAQQVEEGNMSAEEAALGFHGYVNQILTDLEQMGVDPAQFEHFRTQLDLIFESPVVPDIDTEPFTGKLGMMVEQARVAAWEIHTILSEIGEVGGRTLYQVDPTFGAKGGTRFNTARRSPSAGGKGGSRVWSMHDTPAVDIGRGSFNDAYNKRLREQQEKLADESKREADERKRAADEAKRAAEQAERAAEEAERIQEQIADVREEIKEINDEGRIFEETMKRLSEEFSKVFDENFGLIKAQDAVEMSLINMRKGVEDNKQSVKDLREEYHKLRREASQARVEERQARLFESIAKMYGDNIRAEEYGVAADEAAAVVAEKTGLAEASKKEADELEKTMFALKGYSEQAIQNREDLINLQDQMIDLIEEYARTGATTEEVAAFAEDLRQKLIDQATQMGYNESDVIDLTGVFEDLIVKIYEVPRDVRIEVDADTREAHAKLDKLIEELEKKRTVPVEFKSNQRELTVGGAMEVQEVRSQRMTTNRVETVAFSGGGSLSSQRFMARGGVVPGRRPEDPYLDNMYATTGSDVIRLQSGEGIVTNRAMDYYGGASFINAVNNLSLPSPAPVFVNSVVNAPDSVRIAPDQINELARKVSMIVGIDGRTVAATTNRHNTMATNRGQ